MQISSLNRKDKRPPSATLKKVGTSPFAFSSAASGLKPTASVSSCPPPSPPRNRRDHQNFIAVLERVLLIAQEPNIFLVHIEVDEAADLPILAAQMLAQRWKKTFDFGNQLRQVRCVRCDFPYVVGVLLKRIRQQNPNGHFFLLPGRVPGLMSYVLLHKPRSR